ncbi:MAG: penicillin-binding protein 2, partial [Bacteroidales bacterium]|nr:penicillin-binding protein 2 [Bacteroidales bacterium]
MSEYTGEDISKGIRKRYLIIVILCFSIMLFGIISAAFHIQFAEGAAWTEWKNKQQRENEVVPANRGNIFSDEGLLMAVTVPSYALYMDFQAVHRDTLNKYMKPLCRALSQKFGDLSPADFEARLREGQRRASRYYLIHRRRVSYADWKEIKTFPLFSKNSNQSGLTEKKYLERQKMFGSLASRTIGDIYAEFDKGGRNGLELKYDSLLRGHDGISTRQKVAGQYMNVNNKEPEDGWNLKTTINIPMQDIVETALKEMLEKTEAASGTVVLMEVKTGKIKAISNLGLTSGGIYQEIQNYAVSDLSEPGSTFKTIAMMAALEEGKIKPNDSVDTQKGLVRMYGHEMRDHNQAHGGYGKITAARSIWYSSNIGISTLVDKAYADDPARFVDRLYKMKINQPIDIEIPGAGYPDIPHPKNKNRYWSKTDLPWMSIGYVVRIPPIYTLTYYNAIANNACMVKPFFVEEIFKDNQVLKSFDTDVINSKICSDRTLREIRAMLDSVVERGTGTAAKSKFFPVAGKTGTAVLSKGSMGYKAGGKNYQVSFCGYFPSDRP